MTCTEKEEKNLVKLRSLLTSKFVKYDIDDFDRERPKEYIQESAMVKAYNAKCAEYIAAVMVL